MGGNSMRVLRQAPDDIYGYSYLYRLLLMVFIALILSHLINDDNSLWMQQVGVGGSEPCKEDMMRKTDSQNGPPDSENRDFLTKRC